MDWKDRALCVGLDDYAFSTDPAKQRHLKRLCERCAVRNECLELGQSFNGYGIWGGLDREDWQEVSWFNTELQTTS